MNPNWSQTAANVGNGPRVTATFGYTDSSFLNLLKSELDLSRYGGGDFDICVRGKEILYGNDVDCTWTLYYSWMGLTPIWLRTITMGVLDGLLNAAIPI